jgi:hypothetical protein
VAGDLVGTVAGIQLPSPFHLWTTPAWLAWYLYAMRGKASAITPAV